MSTFSLSGKTIATSPVLAVVIYAGLVIALLFTVGSSITDLVSQHRDLASAATMLDQLEARKPAAAPSTAGEVAMPAGSAFLEGETVTVAGAALLQRVTDAVAKAGGNILSTQLDVQGTRGRPGALSMIANFEVAQSALQKILYDLEAGMPFLFIDQLVVQSPVNSSGGAEENGKLQIRLAVSGQWRGNK